MVVREKTDTQYRYVEFRYDGDRTISGTLLRYGDVATFAWGDKERFERGAFGDVSKLDLILNVQHDRGVLWLGRKAAGWRLWITATSIDLRATLSETTAGNDALALIKQGVFKGLSVEFKQEKYRLEMDSSAAMTQVHTKSELRGAGIVDRPQYRESTLREQFRAMREGAEDMEKEEIQRMIDEANAKREESFTLPAPNVTVDTSAFEESLKRFTDGVPEMVNTAVDAALQKRAEESEAAEAERMKKEREDDEDEDKKKFPKDMAEVDAMVQMRSDLIVQVRSLLPTDFASAGKTTHEILVAAAGDEIERATEQSEDYLKAKVEGILERREGVQRKSDAPPANRQVGELSAPVSAHSVVVARNAAQMRAKTATTQEK